MTFAAVLLVGGRATRMGGIAKPWLEVGGRTLFESATSALRDAGCRDIVAVGEAPDGKTAADMRWTREDPPFGGPAAAIVAALDASPPVGADWTFVLAGDLPRACEVIAVLRMHALAASDHTESFALRAGGREQYLAGIHRTAALRRARAAAGDASGTSVRHFFHGMRTIWIDDVHGIAADVDTPDDLARARAARADRSPPASDAPEEDA